MWKAGLENKTAPVTALFWLAGADDGVRNDVHHNSLSHYKFIQQC